MNKSIGKLLREARLKKGLKQIEVAQKAGISQPYYNLIENDKSRPPSFYAIEKIAHVLGCDPKPLIKILEYKQLEYKTKEIEQRKQVLGIKEDREPYGKPRQIPVLNSVSTDKLIDTDEYPPDWADEWIEVDTGVTDPKAFALRVQGNSMEPEFKEGEYVVIAPNIQWENGDYVAVVNPKGEAALKKIRKNKDHMLLIPENPKYEPIVLNEDENPRVIGKVVRKIKKY